MEGLFHTHTKKTSPEMTASAQKPQFNWQGRTVIISLWAVSHKQGEDNFIQIPLPSQGHTPQSEESGT